MSPFMDNFTPQQLLDALVLGWGASRCYETDVVDGHLAVLRHDTTQDWEYFFHEPDAETFLHMAEKAKESPARMLTVVTSDLDTYRELVRRSGLEILRDTESIMAVDMSVQDEESPVLAKDSGFFTELRNEETRVLVSVTFDGQLAASGRMSVRDNFATFDKILTQPAFRRRGLASHMMRVLTADGRSKGATTGLLPATIDGQKLYETMGWKTVYPIMTLGNREKNPIFQGTV